MIGSLRGTLIDRGIGEVLVEVGGIGYRVTVTPGTSVDLGELGDIVFVHVHHHVREDDVTLYGFAAKDERICFEALIGAHGVGPSLALAILSVHTPAQLRLALASDDLAALCLVPGVGRKTAARLLVELKSKLDLPDIVDITALAEAASGRGPSAAGPATGRIATTMTDVRDALTGLGYETDEIRDVLGRLPADGDAAELVRHALKLLAVRV
jgi:holliday junction DNA helicase RuvA